MTKTIEEIKLRIHKLKTKDAIANARLIAKLERKIRVLGDEENKGRE